MNTPLRRVGLAMMAMMLLLLGNATYVQVIKADDYRKDPLNRRVVLDQYSRERGQIIAADGTPLASVQRVDDRLKYLRTYANGPVFAPVTGYFSTLYGAGCIERSEDDLLNGSDDRLFARAGVKQGARRLPEPNWADLALELKKPGVTLMLLWEDEMMWGEQPPIAARFARSGSRRLHHHLRDAEHRAADRRPTG